VKFILQSLVIFSAIVTSTTLTSTLVSANEVMTDRCSKDVAFVPNYDANPSVPGTIVLTRDASGNSGWSQPFTVGKGSKGHIRWWCNNTTGNMFDPGTWRIDSPQSIGGTAVCVINGVAVISGNSNMTPAQVAKQCAGVVRTYGSSAWNGWTPEQSRCNSKSGKIRARLGSNRLLQTECL
jgi:hypothetical protein